MHAESRSVVGLCTVYTDVKGFKSAQQSIRLCVCVAHSFPHICVHVCFLHVDDSAQGVQDATSLFHRHRWLEERKRMYTTYSASLVSSARDSSPLVMNFT